MNKPTLLTMYLRYEYYLVGIVVSVDMRISRESMMGSRFSEDSKCGFLWMSLWKTCG